MSWRLFRFPVGYSCIVFCCLYVIFLAACLHLVVHFTACTLDKSKELRKTIPGFLECFNTCYVHKQTWQKCERQCIHTSAVPLSLCVCWHMDVTVKCRMKPGRIVIFISHFNVHMVFITVGESGTEFRKKKKREIEKCQWLMINFVDCRNITVTLSSHALLSWSLLRGGN